MCPLCCSSCSLDPWRGFGRGLVGRRSSCAPQSSNHKGFAETRYPTRAREPPSFFFFLGHRPRWEESSPSGPWPPWRRRGGSPSEIGSPSLFSSVLRSPDLALHGFLNSRRSVTPIALNFYMIFPINYLSCARRRAPTDLRGGHKIPGRARGCPARPGGLWSLWAPVCVDSTSQKSHIFQKNLCKFLSRLDFV